MKIGTTWKRFKQICIYFVLFILFSTTFAYGQLISESRIMGIPDEFYNHYIAPLKGKKQVSATIKQSSHRGSYKEIGRSLAKFILKTNPNYKKEITKAINSIYPEDHPVQKSDTADISAKVKIFFPEILDEIEGFAEVMKIKSDDAIRIFTQYGITRFGGCTIFAVGKEKTSTNNTLIGRNYDWLPTFTDNHIVSTSPRGGYKSIGFSDFVIGRLDGLNEHGLFVGIAATAPDSTNPKGFFFPIIVRAILDKAKNVNEAINILQNIPHSDGTNFLVADRSGKAAVVEISSNENISIRWLKDNKENILITTNHYQNNETKYDNKQIMPNSLERIHIIKRLIKSKETISETDTENILTQKRPNGVHMKNYEGILGTLYSSIYNLEKGTWQVKAGGYNNRFSIRNFTVPNRNQSIVYENEEPFLPDYISTNGFDPVDQNSFFFQYGFAFMATPIISPIVELTANYKIGLFETEKTYGPHINAGIYTLISPAFIRVGMKFAFNPIPLFSLEVTPFYFLGWRVYDVQESSTNNADAITELIKDNKSSPQYSPALIINPIFNLGPLLSVENKFTFYWFNERVYDYRTSLLVRRHVIWSPTLQVLVPFSRSFLWGFRFETNLETADGNYNMQIGPMVVFPKLFAETTLVVIPSWWIHQSEGDGWWNITIALRGQF